jgi:hypothetical protein
MRQEEERQHAAAPVDGEVPDDEGPEGEIGPEDGERSDPDRIVRHGSPDSRQP